MAKAGDIPGLMQDVLRDGADAYRAAMRDALDSLVVAHAPGRHLPRRRKAVTR